MPGSWLYDVIYRFGAPWEIGVRGELRELVASGRLAPAPGERAIDLGCGTGANTVFLAQSAWRTVGVDFSSVALRKSEWRAQEAGVDVTFVKGDVTADTIPGAEGPFGLLLDYGTLDDLRGDARQRMAALMTRRAAPAPGASSGVSSPHARTCPASASAAHHGWPRPSSPGRWRNGSGRTGRSRSSRR